MIGFTGSVTVVGGDDSSFGLSLDPPSLVLFPTAIALCDVIASNIAMTTVYTRYFIPIYSRYAIFKANLFIV